MRALTVAEVLTELSCLGSKFCYLGLFSQRELSLFCSIFDFLFKKIWEFK